MNADNKSVGYKISYIRNELNMTQEEFAQKIVNKPNKRFSGLVGNWEQGRNLPNKARLFKIAELGNITVKELFGTDSTKTVEEIINEIKSNYSEEEVKEIIRKLI